MFDPYHKWLGIPPQDQPPNHYRLLGVPLFESDGDVIETAADKNMSYIRGCATGPHVEVSQRLLNEISAARICLLNPKKKLAYDTALKAKLNPPAAAPQEDDEEPAAFLTEPVGRTVAYRKKSSALTTIITLVSVAVCGGVFYLKRDLFLPAPKEIGAKDKKIAAEPVPGPAAADPKKEALGGENPAARPAEVKPAVVGATPSPESVAESTAPDPAMATRKSKRPGPATTKSKRPGSAVAATNSKQPDPDSVPFLDQNPDKAAMAESALIPVPSIQEQQAAEKTIRQVFSRDYAEAAQPAEKQALARKLLKNGVDTEDDPIGRFVLLREARDIAADVGAFGTAMEAIDSIGRWHEIDAPEMRFEALAKVVKPARPVETFASFSLSASVLLDEALAADNYDLAKRLAPLVLTVAQKSNNQELVKLATARGKEIESLEKSYQEMLSSREVLKTRPNDPEANLTVGRFLCLIKEDWEQGIMLLALSEDEALKPLAVMELERIPESLAIADGWWKVSESLEGPSKSHVQSHAAQWDRKALPNLTGLTKSKVEKRLATVTSTAPALAGIALDNAVSGRMSPAAKASLVRSMGGTAASEAAVAEGLRWLAKHQFADGSWSVAHSEHPDCRRQCRQPGSLAGGGRPSATGLALLAFLGSGHTHQSGDYQEEVKNGVEYLLKNARSNSQMMDLCPNVVANEKMYTQAICTIALSELAVLSKDGRIKSAAKSAVAFITAAQNPKTGGWRYTPLSGDPGDTSVVAWQIMALKSAKNAKITFNDLTFKGAENYLNAAQMQGGSQYRYDLASKTPTALMTAAGLLCRMYLGWDRKNKSLQDGVKYLAAAKPKYNNMYYNYYATQVMHHWGGEEWIAWNDEMRDLLVRTQNTERDGHERGSWDLADTHGEAGGRLYMTSMALMTLEVYYRHLPILRREVLKVEP